MQMATHPWLQLCVDQTRGCWCTFRARHQGSNHCRCCGAHSEQTETNHCACAHSDKKAAITATCYLRGSSPAWPQRLTATQSGHSPTRSARRLETRGCSQAAPPSQQQSPTTSARLSRPLGSPARRLGSTVVAVALGLPLPPMMVLQSSRARRDANRGEALGSAALSSSTAQVHFFVGVNQGPLCNAPLCTATNETYECPKVARLRSTTQ
jgi:hypothetical protein